MFDHSNLTRNSVYVKSGTSANFKKNILVTHFEKKISSRKKIVSRYVIFYFCHSEADRECV